MFDTAGDGPAVPGIADEFFVLCHDEHTGRPRLHAEAMGLGLAGGLLAELALAAHVDVVQGRLLPTSRRGVPADPLAHQVHLLLQSESHTLPDWFHYLAASARERVGTRLVDAGVVRRVQRRGLLRPVVRYPALDPDRAAWTAGRLRALLLHGLQAGDVIAAWLRSVPNGAPTGWSSPWRRPRSWHRTFCCGAARFR